jgi:hypothetical protein
MKNPRREGGRKIVEFVGLWIKEEKRGCGNVTEDGATWREITA